MQSDFLESDYFDDMVEWVNGERISLYEYDRRIQDRITNLAGHYFLTINSDYDWIFR